MLLVSGNERSVNSKKCTRLRVRQGQPNVVFFLFEMNRRGTAAVCLIWRGPAAPRSRLFLRSESGAEVRGCFGPEGNLYILRSVPALTCGAMRVAEQRVTVA